MNMQTLGNWNFMNRILVITNALSSIYFRICRKSFYLGCKRAVFHNLGIILFALYEIHYSLMLALIMNPPLTVVSKKFLPAFVHWVHFYFSVLHPIIRALLSHNTFSYLFSEMPWFQYSSCNSFVLNFHSVSLYSICDDLFLPVF